MSYFLSGMMFLIALTVKLAKKSFGFFFFEKRENIKWKILYSVFLVSSFWISMKLILIIVSWYNMSLG